MIKNVHIAGFLGIHINVYIYYIFFTWGVVERMLCFVRFRFTNASSVCVSGVFKGRIETLAVDLALFRFKCVFILYVILLVCPLRSVCSVCKVYVVYMSIVYYKAANEYHTCILNVCVETANPAAHSPI